MDEVNELPDNVEKIWNYLVDNSREGSWSGFGTATAKVLRMNQGYFYRCMTLLEHIGSIEKIKHGSNGSPSLYKLIKPPEGVEYQAYKTRSLTIDRARAPSKYDKLQDSITRLTNRVNDLEQLVERLISDRHDVRRDSSLP